MPKLLYRFILTLSLLSPLTTWATHQVGGHLEMRAVGDVPGHFMVTVTNYFEDNVRAGTINSGIVGIFRRRDNAPMTTFTAYESARRSPIIYANSFCATQRNLKFITVLFGADITLNPAQYSDPGGYYVSYQTRNRNAGVNNLYSPLQTGFTFYLEFPPLTTTGKFIHNSSPQFALVNGEYVCMGQPFTFPFGGTDPDGDELRYSLVAPLDQRTNTATAPGPYPTVAYASGFSVANSIPGNPALSVNAQTGQLSVTASQVGLFVFGVRVDEYRNGQKIGEVRRDFQLLVVDCPTTQTPDPAAQFNGLSPAATKTTLCPGESTTLICTTNPDWNYQWQRNGINLPNATGSSLPVSEQGEYTVQVSLKNACTKVGGTQRLTVNSLNTKPLLTYTGQLCATDGSASIHVSGLPDVVYQWQRDGKSLPGETLDSTLTTQPGIYQALLTHKTLGCQVLSDQLNLARAPAVVATLRPVSGFARICPNATLELVADGGIQYAWGQGGSVIPTQTGPAFSTKIAGAYTLTATDANGCHGMATPLSVSAVPPVSPTLGNLTSACGTQAPLQTLMGTPAGGTFGGPGTVAGVFSPAVAGLGQHVITYTVRPAPECAAVLASQPVTVYPVPTIDLADEMTTFRGNSFILHPALTGDPTQFRWSPMTGLNGTNGPVAQVEGIQQAITYTLRVENAGYCTATDSIRISVTGRIYAPDAFTPNGDGNNDQWQLVNILAYPAVEVTIFNRWGSPIFHGTGPNQEPFDGRQDGTDLPDGVYTYVIRPDPKLPGMQGRLFLLR